MVLWRQTAMGQLSGWFGPSLLQLDRLNKQLRFSTLAQATYDSLSPDEQQVLLAYTEGVNAALTQKSLLSHNDFAFLGADIASWEPWHTLAIERLFAWLSTDFASSSEALTSEEESTLAALVDSDNALHQFLQIYDFGYSFAGAWQADDLSESTYFYHRLVYGASAHSIVQEVVLKHGEESKLIASVPGTLTFLSIISDDLKWGMIPTSALSIDTYVQDVEPEISHERITNRDGTEILATFNHYPGLISLDPLHPDTTHALVWEGLQEGTDAFTFLGMLQHKKANFSLLEGHGYWHAGSAAEISGNPNYVHELNDGLIISELPWAAYMADHLDSLSAILPDQINPKLWNSDCYNPWAAEKLPVLYAGIDPTILDSMLYQDAVTYLRNWDYSYTPASIGAAIFEQWLQNLGVSSISSRLDTTWNFDAIQLTQTFKESVDSLSASFGTDLSQWRLEQTQPVRRYYPAWAADSLYSADETLLSETNYAPLYFPGKGDAATLCGGSFESASHGTISAQWEGWHTIKGDKAVTYWRKHVTPKSFLERYLISNRPNKEYRLDLQPAIDAQTTIRPSS